MKLILFLGAGVSVPSGLPTADKLTTVLCRADRNPNRCSHISPKTHGGTRLEMPDDTGRIRRLLRLLRNYDQRDISRVGYVTSRGRSSGAIYRNRTSYEDLFYLCQQMMFWADGRIDNSLVTPLMELLARKARNQFVGTSTMARMSDLGMLAGKACFFIESVVAGALYSSNVIGFDLIFELAKSPAIEQLNIVTLNHDTLVEQFLLGKGVIYVDGFGRPDGDVRWYEDALFDTSQDRVRLLKLHGSVNWYSSFWDGIERPVVFIGDDVGHIRDSNANELFLKYRRPSFLSGLNKEISYQRGIYSDMHFHFLQLLRDCDLMVMSGYGWSDLAITLRLDTWFDQQKCNTLILLHRSPEELSNRSVHFAAGHDAWTQSGQLITINKWMCDVKLSDIGCYFFHGRVHRA